MLSSPTPFFAQTSPRYPLGPLVVVFCHPYSLRYPLQIVTVSALEAGHGGSTDGLSAIYADLHEAIRSKIVPLVPLSPPCTSLWVVSRCVVPTLAPHLTSIASGDVTFYFVDQHHSEETIDDGRDYVCLGQEGYSSTLFPTVSIAATP